MKQIIAELMEPRAFSDGHVRTPTAIMMKAGKALMQTIDIAQNDRTGRIRAETLVNQLEGEVTALRSVINAPEDAKKIYQEAMNRDYTLNFT